jgi:cytochrome c-type biogenesis protein
MASATILGAFVAGLLSFLSPCVLPLTPVYLARLVGPGIWQGQAGAMADSSPSRRTAILHAAVFVAGFSMAFIALGATASVVGSFLAGQALLLRQIGGIVLVVLGAHVAGVLPLPGLAREWRLGLRTERVGYPISFLVGLIFALGWTPCVGPILAGILVLAAQAATLQRGVLLLAVYSLGLGLPFLALGLAFDRLTPWLTRLSPHVRAIEVATGALLALMGLAIFFNWLLVVNSWLPISTPF